MEQEECNIDEFAQHELGDCVDPCDLYTINSSEQDHEEGEQEAEDSDDYLAS